MKIFLFPFFVASASGIFITCQFNFDFTWNTIGRVYTCKVTSMDFADNSTHITGYDGTHLSENLNANVKMIHFPYENCAKFNLTIIPKGLASFFPNFIAFNFDVCSISSLNGDELNEYPNLQFYAHQSSKLIRIPGNFFASTPNIKVVGFFNNKIQDVGEGLLDNLHNLQVAFFDHNVCINKIAYSPSEIPALIEALRQNCPKTELTTTISTMITTSQPPRCEIDDFEDFVCELDEEIENLKQEIKNLQDTVVGLEASVEEVNSSNDEMRRELQNQADAFLQLEQMVIYLSTRP